jgi:ComF family protein
MRVCDACRARWAPLTARCTRCAIDVAPGIERCGSCLLETPAFDAVLAAVPYAAPWDRLVAAFKFHDALDLAPVFADLLVAAHAATPHVPAPSLLLPVPLAPARLRERGYNQAWELARRLARRWRIAAEPNLLLRVRETPHQLALAPERRVANVRGAFAIEPLRLHEVRGRAVTVVDDVMTTGATVGEIARVLRHAGATRVDVWVVARTPRDDDAAH